MWCGWHSSLDRLLDDAEHLHGQSHDAFERMTQLAAAVDSVYRAGPASGVC